MKFLFGFITVLLVGAIIFFFTKKNDSSDIDEPTTIEKLNNQSESIETTKNQDAHNHSHGQTKKNESSAYEDTSLRDDDSAETEEERISAEESLEENSDEDMDDTPEYSEEVSSEDFKEFIGIAIEELEAGDELAEAIITEMIKIAEAQPDHVDQVKGFYRACSEKSGVSNDNQQLCLKFLEKLNEQSN